MWRSARLGVLVAGLGACVADPAGERCDGVRVRSGDGFFSTPFPSDDRRIDGRPSYDGFPSGDLGLVAAFVEAAEKHDGWSPYTTIFVPFASEPDLAALPASPADSTAPASALRLVDVDPRSPAFGEAVPIRWRYEAEVTSMLRGDTLAVRPVWGAGMRPSTTYQLQFSGRVACRAPGSTGARSPDGGLAVQLTTADMLGRLAGMADVARYWLPEGSAFGRDFVVQSATRPESRLETESYVGVLDIPRWQQGEKPYLTEGGDIALEDGRPVIDGWDEVPVAVVAPDAPAPAGGWPVVIYLNGTGSTFDSLFAGFGETFAAEGMVSVAIDLPLHGDRGVGQDPSATFVNIQNPVASVMSTLQGAADQVFLADLLSRPRSLIDTPEGQIPIRDGAIVYFGHSQGGITGALAAAHWDGKVAGAMLSGTGGGLLLGAQLNSGGIDYPTVVASLLSFVEGEVLDDFHPVGTLIQHAGDWTDPLYTARHWFARGGAQERPLPAMFLSLGTADPNTAPVTTQALAAEAALPVVRPVVYEGSDDRVIGLERGRLPLSGNLSAFDGSPVTAGLVQYEDGAHGVVIQEDWQRVLGFLRSAADGRASLR